MQTRPQRVSWIVLLAILCVGVFAIGAPHDLIHADHGDEEALCALCVCKGFEVESPVPRLVPSPIAVGLAPTPRLCGVDEKRGSRAQPRAPPA